MVATTTELPAPAVAPGQAAAGGQGAGGTEGFLDALRAAHGGTLPLYAGQERALRHDYRTPLWIVAGPGTGKTHTLVWLVLKRILADGVPPDRILLTTFTRKAAAELQSRLIQSRQRLVDADVPGAAEIDVSQISVGTLHSLCSRILRDQRYEPTLRIGVLEDELTQQFFLRRSRNVLLDHDDLAFWQRFAVAGDNDQFLPNRAKRAAGLCDLYNRLTENSVDVPRLLGGDDEHLARLGEGYRHYQQQLTERYRTDQAHLQRHFLDFLNTAEGAAWLGDGRTVLVDEYQDTNPIQEELYFTLAWAGGDLTVVGDDDQSLYRFRGATVESLIDFDRACVAYLGADVAPTPVYLDENRRSHPQIVRWVNRFIAHHPEMREQDPKIRVRAPRKPELRPRADLTGPYPAVMAIAEASAPPAARKLAETVGALKHEGLVSDWSQIALLTFSARETNQAIGTYTGALRAAGIPLHNPRSGRAQRGETLLAMVGAISKILDPDGFYADPEVRLPRGLPVYVATARAALDEVLAGGRHAELGAYLRASAGAVAGTRLEPPPARNYLERDHGRRVTVSHLLYKLLAFEPFASELGDAEGGERLKALNLVVAAYESLYHDGELRVEEGAGGETNIARSTLYDFYGVLLEGIHGGLNDPEDAEISVHPGAVNVMTIHQSKGLEFEVVFVLRPDKQPFVGRTHLLEDELDPFITRPTKPTVRRSRDLRAAEDAVRLFYVAYSRAKRLLVLTGSSIEKWDRVLGRTAAGTPLGSKDALRGEGVPLL